MGRLRGLHWHQAWTRMADRTRARVRGMTYEIVGFGNRNFVVLTYRKKGQKGKWCADYKKNFSFLKEGVCTLSKMCCVDKWRAPLEIPRVPKKKSARQVQGSFWGQQGTPTDFYDTPKSIIHLSVFFFFLIHRFIFFLQKDNPFVLGSSSWIFFFFLSFISSLFLSLLSNLCQQKLRTTV